MRNRSGRSFLCWLALVQVAQAEIILRSSADHWNFALTMAALALIPMSVLVTGALWGQWTFRRFAMCVLGSSLAGVILGQLLLDELFGTGVSLFFGVLCGFVVRTHAGRTQA